MAAVPLNLTIEQGTDFEVSLTVRNKNKTPLNLLGYTATAKLKKHYSSQDFTSFVVTFLDRSNGRISISMSNSVTSTLKPGRHVYDVLLTAPNNLKSRVIEGTVIVEPGVI